MKKLLFLGLLWASVCGAQTFPVNNLQVNGALTASGSVSGVGFSNYLASPPAIGSTAPNAGAFTSLSASGSFASVNVNDTSGVGNAGVGLYNSGTQTWGMGASPGNWVLARFVSGVFTDDPISVNGSNGVVNFTQTPFAPTVGVGTNNTQLATTGFVANHAPCPSIMDNGGINNGTGDNRTAFAATAALGPSGQACVYFPPGTYAFGGNLSYSLSNGQSITILGAGMGVTKLQWAGGGGMTIAYANNQNFVNIANLSITTGTTNTGTGLTLFQGGSSGNAISALSTIVNVAINGSDGVGQTDYWNVGLAINTVSNVDVVNVSIFGAGGAYSTNGQGVNLSGASDGNEAVQLNFWGCVFQYVGIGMYFGDYVQGVTVTNSNFTGDNIGIETSTSNAHQSGLTVIGSQFNCLGYGIYDQTAVGIAGLFIDHNYFELPYNGGTSVVAVILSKIYLAQIIGNIIERIGPSATGLNGIVVQGSSTVGAMISGNVIFAMTTGIWLQTGSTNINVQSNFYNSNGTNVVNSCSSGCTVGGGSQ